MRTPDLTGPHHVARDRDVHRAGGIPPPSASRDRPLGHRCTAGDPERETAGQSALARGSLRLGIRGVKAAAESATPMTADLNPPHQQIVQLLSPSTVIFKPERQPQASEKFMFNFSIFQFKILDHR